MKAKYLVRLDDACPTMNRVRWKQVEELLDYYCVKPIVAVIPQNEDPKQQLDSADTSFWQMVNTWQSKGWVVALHGFNHVYTTLEGGLVPKSLKSEFAGIPFDEQCEKIRKGVGIFREHGIDPVVWVAPSHSFDGNTLRALEKESNIHIISDGISIHPYRNHGFIWLPQQFEKLKTLSKLGGVWTLCKHPSVMTDYTIEQLGRELCKIKDNLFDVNSFSSDHIEDDFGRYLKVTIADRLFAFTYLSMKKLCRK